jgi:RNA polymerase sigma factor (sigma-70 family)
MPTSLERVVTRLTASAADPRTDADLVAAFLRGADEAAFAELIRRHGPTVLGVCRRFLGPTPDADDAFQATFLVLVRRARHTDWRASLGPWLYGVALRVARKARAVRARRRASERQASAMTVDAPTPTREPDDADAVIDAELAALPANYRVPLVMCEIQGISRRDAARELGIAGGTLSSRLARGRKLLRERLARRGVVPVTAGLAVTVPAGLTSATARSAVGLLTRTAGAVPAAVLSLTEGVVKAMIVKWKLAAVLVALCVGLSGFGAWRGAVAPQATAADPPATTPPLVSAQKTAAKQPPAARKPDEPVATIFGDVSISREEFADHLIRKYGKRELEPFVNRLIIAHAFGKKGWTIRADEVLAEFDADCKAIGMSREEFAKNVLPRYNKTQDEWIEDVITPRIMLAQLCKAKIPAVTEAELRQAFDAKYGEKVQCRVIWWGKDEGDKARAAHESVRDDKEEFDRHARRSSNANLAATAGLVPPIPRTPPPDATELHAAAANLKAGEVSPLVATADGFVVVKCIAVIPADKTKSFDTEKPLLLAEVHQAKINRAVPKLFDELKQQANPKYHLTFSDSPILPNPAPAKKP